MIKMQTKVLLVCIQNKKGINITNDEISKVFSTYGKIERILIFERTIIWKLFIEFETIQQATQALNHVNNTCLDREQKLSMCVYPSNLETVVFLDKQQTCNRINQNQYIEQGKVPIVKQITKCKTNNPKTNTNIEIPKVMDDMIRNDSTDDEAKAGEQKSRTNSNSKVNSLSYMDQIEDSTKNVNQIQSNIFQEFQYQMSTYMQPLQQNSYQQQIAFLGIQQFQLELQMLTGIQTSDWVEQKMICTNIYQDELLKQLKLLQAFKETMLSFQKQNQERIIEEQKRLAEQKLQIAQQQIKQQSKVVVARWFDESLVSTRMLYNLFSIYGNIEKMLFIKDKSTLLVQYHLQKCADQAYNKLNNCQFQGQIIQIGYSKYECIQHQTSSEDLDFIDTFYEESFIGTDETNRYKPKNSFVAAAPNNTAFLMNLPNELLTIDKLEPLLRGFQKIVGYQFFVDPKEKHSCAIQFPTTEQAMLFVAKQHGIEISGRKIIITFSKKPIGE